jgi:thiol:disulfide interchange protein DsbA
MSLRTLPRLLMVAVLLLPTPLLAQLRFQEGKHYQVVPAPQASGTVPAGKIEVAEVFSYLCVHCYHAQKLARDIASSLPADAAMAYVHAGFNSGWKTFQLGYVTAQLLGIADRNHERMFTGIWETAEVPVFDPATGQARKQPPTLEDVARFYAKGGGVTEADFLKKARSPEGLQAQQHADSLVKAWAVGGTPTFVVAGRYRIESSSVGTVEEMKQLIAHLVNLERTRLRAASTGARAPQATAKQD